MSIKEITKNAIRVMRVITKPKPNEYKQIAKITGAGMVFIGLLGYIISFVARLIS